jgi:hypothetical protein
MPAPVATAQAVVNLVPNQDNTLFESNTGALSNGAGDSMFVGRNNQPQGSIRRGLLSFDIAGSIPAGSTITAARLTLHLSPSNTANQTVQLRRVLATWGEGTSNANSQGGSGAAATANDATWLHRFFNRTPPSMWNTPGGDFATTPSASLTVGDTGFYTWNSTAELVADVQGWLNAPATNFGWILLGNEAAAQTAKRFDTREHATAANRPMLQITYTPVPEPGSIALALLSLSGIGLAASCTRKRR